MKDSRSQSKSGPKPAFALLGQKGISLGAERYLRSIGKEGDESLHFLELALKTFLLWVKNLKN